MLCTLAFTTGSWEAAGVRAPSEDGLDEPDDEDDEEENQDDIDMACEG